MSRAYYDGENFFDKGYMYISYEDVNIFLDRYNEKDKNYRQRGHIRTEPVHSVRSELQQSDSPSG